MTAPATETPGVDLNDAADDLESTQMFHRVEELFHHAVELPAGERRGYLERECAGDTEVQSRVEALLDRSDETLAVPSREGRAWGPFPVSPVQEGPGSVVGRYKLLQVIGEGGFGVVYMAEQQTPVVRKVALKIIKLGMDTKEVVARFEAERQALAMMEHPSIAKVLDGGISESGRPYFVMELDRGVAITEFCDQNDLTTHERLELFRQVCHAVQHAHQKGVIHRDLKPSNVMVTHGDGEGLPKVIDFGVAKAMHTRLTEKTLFTRYEQFVGTPAYMSPEQAQLSALDVDTRTDIYSLGVLLYELLTGTTPFDTAELGRVGLAEVQRVIREEEPARPSLRVSTQDNAAVARQRGVDVPGLGRLLRGDLDWIVMKALEKDRSRRYPTASALADDARRYLDREPVHAGPPGARYRLGKFLARHRAGVGVAVVVVLLVVCGVAGIAMSLVAARTSTKAANEQADRALSAVDFLLSTLSLANPEIALNPDVTVLTLLEHTSAQVDDVFGDDPPVEVRVRSMIGRAYRRLSEYALAESHLRRVLALVDAHTTDGVVDPYLYSGGFNELEHYQVTWALTNVCFNLERPDAFGIASRARDVGIAHVAQEHPKLAKELTEFYDGVEADAWSQDPLAMAGVPEAFDRVTATAQATLPPEDPRWPIVADTFMAAGYTIWYTSHEPLAKQFWQRTLDLQRRELTPGHPDIAATVILLAGLFNRLGEPDRSESVLLESIESLRTIHGDHSLAIAMAEGTLGQTLSLQGRDDEAEKRFRSSHDGLLAVLKSDANWMVLESFSRILSHFERTGESDKAEPFRRRLALAGTVSPYLLQWVIQRHLVDPARAPEYVQLGTELDAGCGGASVVVNRGEQVIDDLSTKVTQFLAARRRVFAGDNEGLAASARLLLGWANTLAPERHRESRRLLAAAAHDTLDSWRATLAIDYAEAAAILSECAVAGSDREAAKRHAHDAWRALATRPMTGSWMVASARARVARTFIDVGLLEQAKLLLDSALETLTVQLGATHSNTEAAREQLVRLRGASATPVDPED